MMRRWVPGNMVPAFEEVYRFTDRISSPTSFSLAECRAYYELLTGLEDWAKILEIGLHLGRSSSIVMQLFKAKQFDYHGIDPFDADTGPQWMRLLIGTRARATVHVGPSDLVLFPTGMQFNLILVDGDHSAWGVTKDIDLAMSHLDNNGYLLFHDYTNGLTDPHVKDVRPTVERLMKWYPGMREERIVDRLGIWKHVIAHTATI